MPWARASSLHRHLACPASCSLPQYERGEWRPGHLSDGTTGVPDRYKPREQTGMTYFSTRSGERGEPLGELAKAAEWGGAADWGTGLHAAKAGLEVGEPYESLMLPHRERLWPNRLGEHEVGVAYNCATRTVEVKRGSAEEIDAWKLAQPDECVVGTCDWFARLPTGEPWVDDLKTGWQKPDVTTDQMKLYLLCDVLHFYGRSRKWTSGRISITHWPRKSFEDEPTREWRQLGLAMLEEFEEDVIAAWRRATTRPDLAIPGIQCLYCPSALVCPKGNE